MSDFFWGFLYIIIGIFLTKRQIKVFKRKEQSKYGFDISLLLLGVLIVFIGIFLIFGIGTPSSLK
jgi:hypothetical protein